MIAKRERRPVVLVTGGARRIGRAIVERFARDDYAVAIHCNTSRRQAEALAAAIRDRGGRACVVTGDLGNPYAPQTLVAQAKAELGPVTVLINNASEFGVDALMGLDTDRFDRTLAVNLRAPIFLARAMAAALPKRAAGAIVNILDQEVLKPTPLFFTYTLSKAALAHATVTMAQALAPRIRVNGLAPGPTLKAAEQTVKAFRDFEPRRAARARQHARGHRRGGAVPGAGAEHHRRGAAGRRRPAHRLADAGRDGVREEVRRFTLPWRGGSARTRQRSSRGGVGTGMHPR